MACTTPQLFSIGVIDATVSNTIPFNSQFGDQVIKNTLTIINATTQAIVYTNTIITFNFSNNIPANTLSNGISYIASIVTYNASGQASSSSNTVNFWCYATPNISITNITDGVINNRNYVFQGSYTGTNVDALNSYLYNLYDSNKNLIQSYDAVYSTALTQEVDNLENGWNYYVQIVCLSQHGQQYQTALIPFTPSYLIPNFSGVLSLTNQNDSGSISISADVVQVTGITSSGTISYINGEWVDLITGNATVAFNNGNGFNINGNFEMTIWATNLSDNIVFVNLLGQGGYLQLEKYNNQIHAFKYTNVNDTNPIISHFVSNTLTMTTTDYLCINLRYVNGLVDLQVSDYTPIQPAR